MRLSFLRFWLVLAATPVALPASAGGIPPFCVVLQVPPESCQAEKALPCTGACPQDLSNNPATVWPSYWKRCRPESGGDKPSLAQKQFMCGAPQAGELHILYYNPVGAYLCCAKNPFVDGTAEPATGNQE